MLNSRLILAGVLALAVLLAGCVGGEQPPSAGAGGQSNQTSGPASLTVTASANGTPVDAGVYLNGTVYGHTPLTVSNITPGVYSVTVNATGFAPNVTSVTVHAGGQVFFNALLLPVEAKAFLHVEAARPGATVTVNGEFKGFAPLNLTLDAGTVTVVVSKAGYVQETRMFDLTSGNTTYFYAPLVPL